VNTSVLFGCVQALPTVVFFPLSLFRRWVFPHLVRSCAPPFFFCKNHFSFSLYLSPLWPPRCFLQCLSRGRGGFGDRRSLGVVSCSGHFPFVRRSFFSWSRDFYHPATVSLFFFFGGFPIVSNPPPPPTAASPPSNPPFRPFQLSSFLLLKPQFLFFLSRMINVSLPPTPVFGSFSLGAVHAVFGPSFPEVNFSPVTPE